MVVLIIMQSLKNASWSSIKLDHLDNGRNLTKNIVVTTLIIGTIAEKRNVLN